MRRSLGGSKLSHPEPLHHPSPVRLSELGSADDPVALVPFFLSRERFPALLLATWTAAKAFLAHEPVFAAHLGPHTAAVHAQRARAALAVRLPETAAAPGPAAAPARPPPSAQSASSASSVLGQKAAGSKAKTSSSPAPDKRRDATPAPASSADASAGPSAATRRVLQAAPATAAAAVLSSAPAALAYRKPTSAGGGAAAAGRTVVSVPSSPVSRGWYADEAAWHAAHAAAVALSSTTTGGRVVPATKDPGTPPDPPGVPPARVMVVAAHARLGETRFCGGAHVANPRYKTAVCREWADTAGVTCPRGVRCDYAHGPLELRLRRDGGPRGAAGVVAGADRDIAVAGRDGERVEDPLAALTPFLVSMAAATGSSALR